MLPSVSGRLSCPICQQLEAEMDRLRRIRAKMHRIVKDGWQYCVSARDFRELRGAESDALLDLEIARTNLNRHKRDKHVAI